MPATHDHADRTFSSEVTLLDGLMTTRAIRRFTSEPVSDEQVMTCLRAAQQAPSGGNVQPQQYVVVTDPDQRTAVARWYRVAFDRYEASLPDPTFRDEVQAASWRRTRDASRHLADHLADVPVLVLVLQPLIPWAPADDEGAMDIGRLDASVYPAVQNLCLAARALGLGTALTTVIRIHTDDVLDLLGVPRRDDGSHRFEIAALVPLGHPAGRFGVAPRRPAESVTHWDRWGVKRSPA
jgi:nitroreductase